MMLEHTHTILCFTNSKSPCYTPEADPMSVDKQYDYAPGAWLDGRNVFTHDHVVDFENGRVLEIIYAFTTDSQKRKIGAIDITDETRELILIEYPPSEDVFVTWERAMSYGWENHSCLSTDD